MLITWQTVYYQAGGYKTFFMLISAEYENSTAHDMCKCFDESVRIKTVW